MAKEIIVNVGERETRIAVTEDGKLVELHVERAERVVGSIYKCRVANVLPGMDAAFVDIGLERNAFLYVGDVLPLAENSGSSPSSAQSAPSRDKFGRGRKSPADRGAPFQNRPLSIELTSGRSHDLAGEPIPQAAAAPTGQDAEYNDAPLDLADEMNGFSPTRDLEPTDEGAYADTEDAELDENSDTEDDLTDEDTEDDLEEVEAAEENERAENGAASAPPRPRHVFRRSALRQQRIKDVLKIGQEVLVQVIKGPRSTKGARVSTRISLPGRYLVLMPEADNLGVSRKIEDSKERDRLKKIGEHLREPGFGLIIRTEAEEKTEQELRQDMDFLLNNWAQIQAKSRQVASPALVQADLSLLYKTIRDIFGSDVNRMVVDDPAEYEKANELLERLSPKLLGRIHLYDGTQPIFDHYGLETEIDRLLRRKVYLKSGGSLVIDETEALTVIDVNTSKFVGSNSLSETILKTNIDAAGEVARQLRLRDIGGIIVIDFIDMSSARDKQSILKTLDNVLKRDRSRTKISNISPLGLVEMTRKRTGETLAGFMTEECPSCKGRGHLASAESVSVQLERELRRSVNDVKNGKKDGFYVVCHPDVAELIIGLDGTTIATLERELQRALFIRADQDGHVEKFTIEPGDLNEMDKHRLGYRRAQVVECSVTRSQLKENGKCIAWADGYLLDLDDGAKLVGQKAKARITDVRRSYACATIIPGTNRASD